MTRVCILTLGCPKNTVASRRLEKALSEIDFEIVGDPDLAQAVIVNTCGFIDAAKEESIELILGLGQVKQEQRPDQKLIAIGCLAQRYGPELTKAIPELDSILGFDQVSLLPGILGSKGEIDLSKQAHSGNPSAYLEISDGCDQKCTFCAIPEIRGAYRSRAEAELIAEAEYLSENGCRELVLIGQDTGYFGRDSRQGSNLSRLIGGLSGVTGIDWIRLLYLQPQHLSEELIATIKSNDKMCLYLDMPFQHASDKIIKRMNRWGGAKDYLKIIEFVRGELPGIALRTSVIVGFPGETKSDLMQLAQFLKSAELDYVGIFEFSAEEGTPAAGFSGQISSGLKRERADQIKVLVDELSHQRRQRFVGQKLDVLIESNDNEASVGRSQYQAPEIDGEIIVGKGALRPGDMIKVTINAHDDYDLTGVVEET